jgi:hypothetical protein
MVEPLYLYLYLALWIEMQARFIPTFLPGQPKLWSDPSDRGWVITAAPMASGRGSTAERLYPD